MNSKRSCEPINDFMNIIKKVRPDISNHAVYIPTGMNDLDLALDGGLEIEGLYILKGKPHSGKTAFATNLACKLGAAGYNTLYFTMQDDLDKVSQKMLSNMSGVPWEVIRGGLLTNHELDLVSHAAATPATQFTSVLWAAETIDDIINEAGKLKMADGLDVIIIDHLELIDNKKISYNQMLHALKNVAKQMNVAVFVISQLSAHNTLADEAAPIYYDSDVLIYLQNDENVTFADEHKIKNDIKLHVYKKRAAHPFEVELAYRPLIVRFD